jgi:anti-anti-sigma factor
MQVQHNENTSIITIDKDQLLGIENETFQALIQNSIEAGSKNILVDLSSVKFITSLGIESFLHARITCENKNINLVLKNVNVPVMNILSTLRLTDLFNIN